MLKGDREHGFTMRTPKKLTIHKSMEMSFFALPSKQGSVQGRFKPTHDSAELVAGLPIRLSTKVAACVRRFETPIPLNDGRPALALSLRSCVWIGEYFTSQFSLLMPYEPGLGQGQSQKKISPCSVPWVPLRIASGHQQMVVTLSDRLPC